MSKVTISKLVYLDSVNCYILYNTTDKQYVMKSIDGGQSFLEVVSFPFSYSSSFTTMAFISHSNGVLIGSNGLVYFTDDGGKSWKDISMRNKVYLNSVYFQDKDNLFVFDGNNLYKYLNEIPISVENKDISINIFTKIYPNPAKTNVSLDFIVEPENLPNITVELYNLTEVLQSKLDYNVDYNDSNGQGTLNCNIENISNGYYIIVIDNGKRKVAKPFIVNKE